MPTATHAADADDDARAHADDDADAHARAHARTHADDDADADARAHTDAHARAHSPPLAFAQQRNPGTAAPLPEPLPARGGHALANALPTGTDADPTGIAGAGAGGGCRCP
jgi:hypothetical protein